MKPQTKKSLLKKIRKHKGCWNFTGAISQHGYGKVGYNGKVVLAHRLSYMFEFGEIPIGMLVCHKCDNRACIRPSHLFLGTHKDNTQDMISKGRFRNGGGRPAGKNAMLCKRGHDISKEYGVYIRPNGVRQCKTCTLYRVNGNNRLKAEQF